MEHLRRRVPSRSNGMPDKALAPGALGDASWKQQVRDKACNGLDAEGHCSCLLGNGTVPPTSGLHVPPVFSFEALLTVSVCLFPHSLNEAQLGWQELMSAPLLLGSLGRQSIHAVSHSERLFLCAFIIGVGCRCRCTIVPLIFLPQWMMCFLPCLLGERRV